MASTVHVNSRVGFAKGTNELYNNARARYQPQALSHLRRAIKSSGSLNVLEIGSGTGLFTRALLAHPDWTAIHKLKAVDPSEGMRETFSKYTSDDRVVVSEGTFDNTGVERSWADLVVIAHAFHWCPDYEAAAAEFSRVIKPEGILSLIWNHEDRDAAEWLNQVRERVERDEKGSPHWRTGHWRQIFDAPSYTKYFLQPEEQIFRYEIPGTTEGIVSRGLSSSRISTLTEREKEEFVQDVEAIMQRGEGKVWIEQDTGTFVYPHRTDLVISKRRA